VLAARDKVLRDTQGAHVGQTLEVIVDEAATKAHPLAIGRTAMDAPEVDLIVRLEKCKAPVGARVKAEVLGLDEESNLVARPVK
jgi:tRNA A37 methylthiotransferase MiaB